MTALPSFVELMSSLGLDSTSDSQDNRTAPHHSRSSSYSSTNSAISNSSQLGFSSTVLSTSKSDSPTPSTREWDSERRSSRQRYSPYTPPISHTRRGSIPAVISSEEDLREHPNRSSNPSPCPGSQSRSVGRRSSALGLRSQRRPEKLNLAHPDFMANTPISTFVRRKTPQSSPISPSFPHRAKRHTNAAAPVLIPTLPTFVFPPLSPAYGSISSDTDDDEMVVDSHSSSYHLEPSRDSTTSTRRVRVSRRSDSNIAFRHHSPALETVCAQATPVA